MLLIKNEKESLIKIYERLWIAITKDDLRSRKELNAHP